MKQILLSFFAIAISTMMYGQCNELFISKYVEGYGNNRAIELYNPTNTAVDLSGYSVGRYSNGGSNLTGIQLPADMIQPYDTYLIVIDKRDSLGSSFETPVWNGYQLYDTCRDALTGMPILDSTGNAFSCVQYDASGLHLYGTVYHDFLDLEGKGDVFLCPDYNVNNAMYFNGNDAVVLITGTTVAIDGSNILDVVGVIGEDPGDAWTTPNGSWLTKDKTLVRKEGIEAGTGVVVAALQDTFPSNQWEVYSKNTFYVIDGGHGCNCDPNFVNTQEINVVPFKAYPNPTNGLMQVEAEANIESIEVFNIMGMKVISQQFNGASNKVQLNLGDLTDGVHVLQVRFNDSQFSVKKIMKQ